MKNPIIAVLPLSIALLSLHPCFPAAAEQRLELGADLQNLFLFRNDSDFDRSRPLYDENGQTVGAFATVFRPSATWQILDNLRLYYELEIGLNFWGKQNPDEQDPLAPDVFLMKHREIYGAGEFFDSQFEFKAGYAHMRDPTGLFLNHWIGAAQASFAWAERGRLGLFFGQVPDQTYEGIRVDENNFKRDIFVLGIFNDLELGDGLRLSSSIDYLHDSHRVGQTRWLICPNAHLEANFGRLSYFLDAIVQLGQSQGRVLGGGFQSNSAWAAQGHVEVKLFPIKLAVTILALSPDDAHDGNWNDLAFFYSGKSRSATLLLTEDEIRDWYDNLDERLGTFEGGFLQNRAGLFLADAKATWEVNEHFASSLIVGAASVLKPKNALARTFVGLETTLLLEYRLGDNLVADLAGVLLLPGSAAAALVNRIDLHATEPIFMTEASLLLHY